MCRSLLELSLQEKIRVEVNAWSKRGFKIVKVKEKEKVKEKHLGTWSMIVSNKFKLPFFSSSSLSELSCGSQLSEHAIKQAVRGIT